MFDIGDYIVYGNNGICKVEDITHLDYAGSNSDKLYYVLIPVKTKDSRLFCPTDNNRVVLRKVITAQEAERLLNEVTDIEPLQVESERLRDDSYKKVMKSCDPRQCIMMMKTLLMRKKEREANGKKVTATDERYMRLAEDGLYAELSLATGCDKAVIKERFLKICNV
ncbi:MAG: CarD family transcriptional regulator [Wujia sp.]